MDDANRTIQGRNPLCGDELTLWMKVEGDAITDVSFKGQGCAISKASASLMTAAVKGKSRVEAEQLFDQFHKLVKGELSDADQKSLGSLRAFAGVAKFPNRVKCASLAWHAMHSAISTNENEVTSDPESQGEGA